MEDNWVLVYETPEPYRAEMAKQLLESNNIEAVVVDKRDSSFLSFGKAELYVNKEDEGRAKSFIKEFKGE